jgi:hypothetical protein
MFLLIKHKKNDLFIIFTIPHAKCEAFDPKHLYCDELALYSAEMMQTSIQGNNDIDSILIIGNISRFFVDLNRKQLYKTKFFKKLKSAIILSKDYNHTILIDVHSGEFKESNSLVVPYDHDGIYDDKIINGLKRNLNLHEIDIKHGVIKENFIIQYAFKNKIMSILLEFNENPNAYTDLNENQYFEKLMESITFIF